MIRMTANIAGYEVELTGHAADVVAELETLRKELTGEKPKTDQRSMTTKKSARQTPTNGPGTEDDQPDLPLQEDEKPDSEPQTDETSAEEPPAVSETQYTIEDVRAAIKDADKDGKERAKGFLIEHGAEKDGKPQLMMLDASHYPALIDAVGGES